MISRTTERFRTAYQLLPDNVRRQTRTAYHRFRQNPAHPSLRFRQVHPTRPIFSARININYRALGVRDDDTIIWFWVGPHDAYDRLLAQL